MKALIIVASLFNMAAMTAFAADCSQPFGQCGGNNWTGPTCCSSGYSCKLMNEWYSQCIPSNEVIPDTNISDNTFENSFDAPNDAQIDTTMDTPVDNPIDIPVIDPMDTPIDTPMDTPIDTPMDTPMDTSIDTPMDTPIDTQMDTPIDTQMDTPLDIPMDTQIDNTYIPNVETPSPVVESSIPDINNHTYDSSSYDNVSSAASSFVSSSSVIGYASLNGGTSGGAGGQTVTVSSQSELEAALKGTNSKIIKINGIVKLNADVTVNSNTSIIGSGKNSGFTGGGLKIKNASNIIIQNLKFSYCLGSNKDCINAQKSNNIWVDHCEFFNDKNHGKDYYDGLIDFTHACDYITISWNYVHDHYKASLIGHSDSNGNEDTGKLHITYHHNYFKNIGSRLPSLRFGTAHVFNNVYENVENSSVNIRMGAKALVEGNVFKNANKPISTNLDSKQEGSVIERNNDFGSTANTNSITKTDGLSSVPYSYTADNVVNVYNAVVHSVGPQ